MALQQDPLDLSARTDLAVLAASSGNVRDSLRLLDAVVSTDPSQTLAGLNLAFLQCSLGRLDEAHRTLAQLRAINPDSHQLRDFAAGGRYGGQLCLGMAHPELTGH